MQTEDKDKGQFSDTSHVSPLTSHVQDDEINLFDYLIVLAKHKKLIIWITGACAVITAIISLIMSPVYQAETRILPPQQSGSSLALSMLSQVGGLSEIAGGALGLKTPADLYVGMIKSRTIADRIIDRFGLMELYDKKYRVDTRLMLAEDILNAQSDSKSGIVSIRVEDKDPQRAADMANAFVEELRNLTKGLAVSEAAQRRLFFEDQLKDTRASLLKAEDEMKGFMEKTGALKVEEQAKAVIEGVAALSAQIAAKEVELRVMRTYSTQSNPDLQRTEAALKGMKAELAKLEAKGGQGSSSLVPTGRMPEVGTEYIRKLRDLKFNETLFELLAKQYELAKIDEARDATVIQVVDKAVPPDKRARPKRTLMVVIATFLGFFISVLAAFFKESKDKMEADPENRKRLETFLRHASFKKRKT